MIAEPFAHGTSLLHRLDPRIRVVAAAGLSVVVALSDQYLSLGLALGSGMGVAFGVVFGNVALGITSGTSIGLCLGCAAGILGTSRTGGKGEE